MLTRICWFFYSRWTIPKNGSLWTLMLRITSIADTSFEEDICITISYRFFDFLTVWWSSCHSVNSCAQCCGGEQGLAWPVKLSEHRNIDTNIVQWVQSTAWHRGWSLANNAICNATTHRSGLSLLPSFTSYSLKSIATPVSATLFLCLYCSQFVVDCVLTLSAQARAAQAGQVAPPPCVAWPAWPGCKHSNCVAVTRAQSTQSNCQKSEPDQSY